MSSLIAETTKSNDDTQSVGPLSAEIRNVSPWKNLETDYIFIAIIGLMFIALCCCALCQYRLLSQTKQLKKELISAKSKAEIKIVRPGTPVFTRKKSNNVPSMTRLSIDPNEHSMSDNDRASNRFFPIFSSNREQAQILQADDADWNNNDDEGQMFVGSV